MNISLTTLGCPEWDLDTICAKGRQYGFDGIDFRGLQDEIDITVLPEFTRGIRATTTKLNNAGLEVSGIASSITLCERDRQESHLEEARRTIAIAHELQCRNIRVFGAGDLKTYSREELAEIGSACMERILELDGADALRWLFETHDHWIQSQDCALLLNRISHPAFGVLWDIGHTSRVGGESPEESYAALGPRIGYAHIKDAIYEPEHELAMEDGWRYVLPGTGQLPLRESITLLQRHAYDGWLLFEHEKRWHPSLPEPEIAFPAFIKWVRPLLK